MNKILPLTFIALSVAACDQVPALSNLTDRPWLRDASGGQQATANRLPSSASVEVAALPDAGSQTAVQDTRPTASASGLLGTTVASLGDATRQGFWIETPLVSAPQKGKVRYPKTGREVKVDLIPRAGASSGGSSLSLGAMRLLDVPLTALAEVEVYAQ